MLFDRHLRFNRLYPVRRWSLFRQLKGPIIRLFSTGHGQKTAHINIFEPSDKINCINFGFMLGINWRSEFPKFYRKLQLCAGYATNIRYIFMLLVKKQDTEFVQLGQEDYQITEQEADL